MKWLLSILGFNDKKQSERTRHVSSIVHKRRNKFSNDLDKLKLQAKRVHSQASKVTKESARLMMTVTDITAKIATATGGKSG